MTPPSARCRQFMIARGSFRGKIRSMDQLHYYFASLVYYVIFMGGWAGLVFGAVWGEKRVGIEPGVVLRLSALAGLVAAHWLARRAAQRLALEQEFFVEAARGALQD